jgi:hypothetical protein
LFDWIFPFFSFLFMDIWMKMLRISDGSLGLGQRIKIPTNPP